MLPTDPRRPGHHHLHVTPTSKAFECFLCPPFLCLTLSLWNRDSHGAQRHRDHSHKHFPPSVPCASPCDRPEVTHDLPPLPPDLLQVPGIGKVTEQILAALGVTTCAHLLQQRAKLSALSSAISLDFYLRCGLGLGGVTHGAHAPEGQPGRKGISCERTFKSITHKAQLEEMVSGLGRVVVSFQVCCLSVFRCQRSHYCHMLHGQVTDASLLEEKNVPVSHTVWGRI